MSEIRGNEPMDAEDNSKLRAELERDEAWLAAVMQRFPAPAPRSLENLKLRLHIAVHEQGLDLASVAQPSAELLEHIKGSVRAEIARQQMPRKIAPAADRWRSIRLTMAGLAAAAVIVFAVVPVVYQSSAPVSPTTAPIEDFVAVLAADPSDTDTELLRVDTALTDLEDTFGVASQAWFDDEIDDLEDAIDSLLIETNNDSPFDT